jgi:ribosomal protein S18 acetylase RimI-like enzyme
MSEIRIVPASADRFDDVEHAFTGGGDGGSCWCQWWMMRARDFDAITNDERRELLRRDVQADPPSGLVAYVDDVPAGWVKVSPRPDQPRLARTKNFQQSPESFDDPTVWAVTCFIVRKEFRQRGVATRLLDAAVAHARTHGARVIEGYPVDTDVKSASSNELFHGALSTFRDAGFAEVARPAPSRPIVSLAVR